MAEQLDLNPIRQLIEHLVILHDLEPGPGVQTAINHDLDELTKYVRSARPMNEDLKVTCSICADGQCEDHATDCWWPSMFGGRDRCSCPNKVVKE